MTQKSFGRILAALLFSVMILTTLLAVGCTEQPKNPEKYIFDEDNQEGFSEWSMLPFVKAEDKAKGFVGGAACQHLTTLARSKNNPDLMFFGTDAAGICRSRDGGKSWVECNVGLFTSGVSQIAIDPKNDDHIVCFNATSSETTSKYSAIFVSYDGGDSWTKSDGTRGLGISASHYYYNSLEFDPMSYDKAKGYCTDVYFSTPCERDFWPASIKTDEKYKGFVGLYKSTDCGNSFEKIEGTEILHDGIIAIHDKTIAIGNMNGIFSLNGNTFVKKSDMIVHSLFWENNTFYVMTDDGIFTSQTLDAFDKLTGENFFVEREPRNLTVSPSNPQHMLLYARKRVGNKYSNRPYFSLDGGKTWKMSEGLESACEGLFYNYTYHAGVSVFDKENDNIIFSIIGGEVIKSTDGGETFRYSGDGVHNVSIGGQFHFNVYDENLVYFGAYDFGGALTTDGGKTFQNISLSKDGDGRDIMGGYAADKDTLFGVYVDTWSPGDYFRDYRYVCFSHDGGKTVNIDSQQIKNDPTVYNALNIDHSLSTARESSYQSPNNRKVLFCANYRSSDNGYTWKNMLESNASGEKCLQVYTHCGKTLYGCSKQSGFVLKSNDDGLTWQKVNTEELVKWRGSEPSHIVDIAVDGQNGYIYAVYGGKLFRMNLDGSEVTDLTKTMVKDNFGVYCIRTVAVDPNFPNIVYCGGSGDFYMSTDGVRRSFDSGNTWVTMIRSSSKQSVMKTGLSLGYEARCLRVKKDGTVWCSMLCLGVCQLTPPYKLK